jgi:hypothetical protein
MTWFRLDLFCSRLAANALRSFRGRPRPPKDTVVHVRPQLQALEDRYL